MTKIEIQVSNNEAILADDSILFKSPFFTSALSNRWSNNSQVDLSIFTKQTVSTILFYLKTGSLEATSDIISSVALASDYLLLPELFNECFQQITTDNSLELYQVAVKLGNNNLALNCIPFITAPYRLDIPEFTLFLSTFTDLEKLKMIIEYARSNSNESNFVIVILQILESLKSKFQFISLKEKDYTMFLSPILKLSNIESKIELESLINCDFFDSLIIKNKRLFNTIMNHTEDIILKNYGIIMNRNLIHRASEYSLCPRSFRHNCQMRGPTIILMRTVDRVCIAFSSKDWMMFGGYKESKGFIGIFGFEDDLELTLECIETRGTYDHNLFGPIFGFSGINDLALSGHVSRSNTTRLFGSKEFDIIEYEVYN